MSSAASAALTAISSRGAAQSGADRPAAGAGTAAGAKTGYWAESRNAIYSFLLALPFVLIYELGIYFNHYRVLNGGDWLLRSIMTWLSPEHAPLASLGALTIAFLAYQFVRNDSLKVRPGVLFGLSLEAVFYAVLLIPLGAYAVVILQQFATPTAAAAHAAPGDNGSAATGGNAVVQKPAGAGTATGAQAAANELPQTPAACVAEASRLSAAVHSPEATSLWSRIVLYCGAGVYEELVFRVLLLWGLFGLGLLLHFPKWVNVPFAAVGSALLFSLFHYYPPGPYPFAWATFIYRALAGMYFTTLVYTRNFGVAVASHAMYDMMVG
ncbi:MAG: CPBP family intramembrane glutamic endopeptidase [Planctomycetota bacterium]